MTSIFLHGLVATSRIDPTPITARLLERDSIGYAFAPRVAGSSAPSSPSATVACLREKDEQPGVQGISESSVASCGEARTPTDRFRHDAAPGLRGKVIDGPCKERFDRLR